MKRILITFGGAAYDITTEWIVRDAVRYGADQVWVYDDRWLMTTSLFRENSWLWTCTGVGNPNGGRGFGWFCWKPYIIQDALSRVDDGDIVMFIDADTYPIHHFGMLYEECHRIGGIMLFRAEGCHHARWCKRDCFIVMGMDEECWRNQQHAVARFMLFQKGAPYVDNFLAQWLKFCLIREATTFDPSVLAEEYPEFYEHRTEQAIFTNLAHQYGLKLYREACQAGATQPEDQGLYSQLFIQEDRTTEKLLDGSRFFHIPGVDR